MATTASKVASRLRSSNLYGARTRTHAAHLAPLFLRPTAVWRFFRDPTASRASKLVLAAAFLYVVWPLDLIPDAAPVIGWLDDLGVASAALAFVATRVSRHASSAAGDEHTGD